MADARGSESARLRHEASMMQERVADNREKVQQNRKLPYLIGHIVEVLVRPHSAHRQRTHASTQDRKCRTCVWAVGTTQYWSVERRSIGELTPLVVFFFFFFCDWPKDAPEANEDESGAAQDADAARGGKSCVIKTSNRQTIFLPVPGIVDIDAVKPGDLVGVNKDSYLILDTLPKEYDSRVKAMEVDERPTEDYNEIGGLDKQIKELVEAVVLPITHGERFKAIGIQPPKGVLMYGPPVCCVCVCVCGGDLILVYCAVISYSEKYQTTQGTGKTLMARACAAETKSCFLKLAGPQLVQMFIGDGAKMVRDAFELAKQKAPAIIFIDELDAIGTKRFNSDKSGDREVQRTMLELLNQLDGFDSQDTVKVIAATNRVDVLDPALLRSGRIDRKIEFPLPNEASRARILEIHASKFTKLSDNVNYGELARTTQDFNGAQLKAAVVEAGMEALRRNAASVDHEDFIAGIAEVQARKKDVNLSLYA